MEITPKELYEKMNNPEFRKDSILVDVRVPGEHRVEKIPSSVNIPINKLEDFKDELTKYKNVYVHCETGGRSGQACEQLKGMMLDNWINVAGGISEWKLQDLPIIEGRGISIQRQVMITAGLFILIGTILSLLVNKSFIALAIFIGAGLIFAGITNFCGMARLLRLMPWNK